MTLCTAAVRVGAPDWDANAQAVVCVHHRTGGRSSSTRRRLKDCRYPPRAKLDSEVLRANAELFDRKGRPTDVAPFGMGYLFATQGRRASETSWRLMRGSSAVLERQLYLLFG